MLDFWHSKSKAVLEIHQKSNPSQSRPREREGAEWRERGPPLLEPCLTLGSPARARSRAVLHLSAMRVHPFDHLLLIRCSLSPYRGAAEAWAALHALNI